MLIGLICPIHSHPTYLFIQSLHTDTHINIKPQAKQTHNTGFGLVIAMIKWSRWPWLYPSCLFQSIYVSSIRNSQQKTLCWLKFSFNRWKVHSQIGTNAFETQFLCIMDNFYTSESAALMCAQCIFDCLPHIMVWACDATLAPRTSPHIWTFETWDRTWNWGGGRGGQVSRQDSLPGPRIYPTELGSRLRTGPNDLSNVSFLPKQWQIDQGGWVE